jgi:hypothetical protein
MLGEAALQANEPGFAYAISTAGLERGNPAEAEFLFLRAQSLPATHFERRMVCAAAAAKLARQLSQQDLAGKAVDFLRGPFKDGSIELTPAQVGEILQKEKKQPVFPKSNRQGPNYRSIVGDRLCQCPDCRRDRGEEMEGLDDFDCELEQDEEFAGLEIPEDMPLEIAELLLQETVRAVANGESVEELLARLGGEGLPQTRSRKSRRK